MDETMFPVASPSLPGIEALRTPGDIARTRLIADAGHQNWHDWMRAAKVRDVSLDEHYRFTDSNAARSAAARGMGVAPARQRTVAPFLASGSMVKLTGPASAIGSANV